MPMDSRQIEYTLQSLDATWSKVHPGKRFCGSDKEGNQCVFSCEDLGVPLGTFNSETEAKAFSSSHDDIECLTGLVKQLIRERNEAFTALKEICQVADPAYVAFNEQKPVDMASVLKVTHQWSRYLMDH